jgi:large subunit ribosomal protein L10
VEDPRPEKVAVVAEVRERLDTCGAALLTEYRGLNVSQLSALRRGVTAAGGEYKIYKNTLVRRAAADSGLAVLESLLVGPTAIVFVRDDAAAVAKVLRDFGRTNPALVIKGGLLGRNVIDASSAQALAELPSREQLLSMLAGGLAAPLQRMASLIQAVPRSFAYGLSALLERRRETEGTPEVAAAESGAPPAEVEVAVDAGADATVESSSVADTAEAVAADAPEAGGAAAESPEAEAAVVETPAAETPAAESPEAEAAVVETPAAETPAAESPEAEAAVVEAPAAETPAAETPAAETPEVAEAATPELAADGVEGGEPIVDVVDGDAVDEEQGE